MTGKELNSHDLVREIEISKLQEENEELKSILKGTTHCFDEEEHNRLKEEITNYEDLLTRQKEFIEWLECEVNDYKCKNPLIVENLHMRYDIRKIETDLLVEVLNKYREIVKGENNNEEKE